MLSAPTLVTGVGELVAEMRAGDTGKAEGGGRQQAGGAGGGGGLGGRRGAAAAAAGRPQSLISQSDLRVTPAHNAIQQHHQLFPTRAALLPFFVLQGTTQPSNHFSGSLYGAACLSETGFGLEESVLLAEWRVVWWVATDASSRFYLILSHSDHSSFPNW